jgi:putative flavoprotein involved in K+ transport
VSERQEVVVVGAGPAGLAAAAMIQRKGVPVIVLERSDRVGSSWRSRYDSLILNTPRINSTLAGYRIPRRYGRWPSRDRVVEYLEEYARRMELTVRFGVELSRVERADGHWSLDTSDGEIVASDVVIATGHDSHSVIPDWPGRDEFPGDLLHSAEYRNPEPFRDRDVLVVSASNSGSEIAYELSENGAARVRTSMRRPAPVFPREWPWRIPLNYTAWLLDFLPDRAADRITDLVQRIIYGDLTEDGIPPALVGAQTRTKHLHQGVLVDAGFVEALKERRIEIVPAVEAFDGPEVILSDGLRLRPDAVIAATGFDRGLEPLVGHLGVLDAGGNPVPYGAQTHPDAPRLYFNGFYSTLSGQLRFARRHGRAIARAIARAHRTAPAASPALDRSTAPAAS